MSILNKLTEMENAKSIGNRFEWSEFKSEVLGLANSLQKEKTKTHNLQMSSKRWEELYKSSKAITGCDL